MKLVLDEWGDLKNPLILCGEKSQTEGCL